MGISRCLITLTAGTNQLDSLCTDGWLADFKKRFVDARARLRRALAGTYGKYRHCGHHRHRSGLLYLVLFAVLFVLSFSVVDQGYLSTQLGHAAGFSDYVGLSWLSGSLGTLAGA